MSMTLRELQSAVWEWAEARNLIAGSSPRTQVLKTMAELGELCDAAAKNDLDGIKDGIGDVAVTLIVIGRQLHGDTGLTRVTEAPRVSAALALDDTVEAVTYLFLFLRRSGREICDVAPVAALHRIFVCWLALDSLAREHGLSLRACLETAYNEIKDRKGRMINGTFVKEADL